MRGTNAYSVDLDEQSTAELQQLAPNERLNTSSSRSSNSSCNTSSNTANERSHNAAVGEASGRSLRYLIVGCSLSAALLLLGGAVSQELVLVSEGVHTLADVLCYFIALAIHNATHRGTPSSRLGLGSFSTQRLPVLGGFFNGCFLATSCLFLLMESFNRLIEGQDISFESTSSSIVTIISGGFGFSMNAIVLYLHFLSPGGSHGHSHSHGHHSHSDDANVHGALLHSLSDMCTSLIVVLTGLLRLVVSPSWFLLLDTGASALITGIIAASARHLLRDNSRILLQQPPMDLLALQSRLKEVSGVYDISALHVWQLDGPEKLVATTKVLCDADAEPEGVARRIEHILKESHAVDVTVQTVPSS